MDVLHVSAVLLIAEFVVMIFLAVITPPGLYTPQDVKNRQTNTYPTEDIERRLEILRVHRTRWIMERITSVALVLLIIIAFWLLASSLQTSAGSSVAPLGAVAMIAGTLAGLYFIYRQTIDPRGGYHGKYPVAENTAYWLWLIGTLLFGIAFLQSGLPTWLGIVTAGAALLYGVVYLLTSFGFMTPYLVGLLSLVIGLVLLGQ